MLEALGTTPEDIQYIYTSPLTYLESCLDMFGADALELRGCLVRLRSKDQIEQHLYPKH